MQHINLEQKIGKQNMFLMNYYEFDVVTGMFVSVKQSQVEKHMINISTVMSDAPPPLTFIRSSQVHFIMKHGKQTLRLWLSSLFESKYFSGLSMTAEV